MGWQFRNAHKQFTCKQWTRDRSNAPPPMLPCPDVDTHAARATTLLPNATTWAQWQPCCVELAALFRVVPLNERMMPATKSPSDKVWVMMFWDMDEEVYYPMHFLNVSGRLLPLAYAVKEGVASCQMRDEVATMQALGCRMSSAFGAKSTKLAMNQILACIYPKYSVGSDALTRQAMAGAYAAISLEQFGLKPSPASAVVDQVIDIPQSWTHSIIEPLIQPYLKVEPSLLRKTMHRITCASWRLRILIEWVALKAIQSPVRLIGRHLIKHFSNVAAVIARSTNRQKKHLRSWHQQVAAYDTEKPAKPSSGSPQFKVGMSRIGHAFMAEVAQVVWGLMQSVDSGGASAIPNVTELCSNRNGGPVLWDILSGLKCLEQAHMLTTYVAGHVNKHTLHEQSHIGQLPHRRTWSAYTLDYIEAMQGLPRLNPTQQDGLTQLVSSVNDHQFTGCRLGVATHSGPQLTAASMMIKHFVAPLQWVVVATDAHHHALSTWLGRMFPPTHLEDTKHMNTTLAALLTGSKGMRLKMATAHLQGLPEGEIAQTVRELRKQVAWWKHMREHIPVGTPQPRVVTLYMSGFTRCSEMLVDVVAPSRVFFGPTKLVNARLSQVSAMLRKCDLLPNYGVVSASVSTTLAYLELSSGRMMNKSDWAAEVDNRCRERVPIIVPPKTDNLEWKSDEECMRPDKPVEQEATFLQMLQVELASIAQVLVGNIRPVTETLKQFYARRHEWVTSGSAAGSTLGGLLEKRGIKADKAAGKLANERVNKRVWADHTPFHVIEAALNGRPVEYAAASEKFENGKARALYGVEPVHYVLNTYCTMGLEAALHHVPGCEKGSGTHVTIAHELKRALLTSDPDLECTMLDYADFNRQHTPEAQALVFTCFADAGRKRGFPEDWVRSNLWVAAAKHNMQFRLPHDPRLYHVVQGMFSGTRSTDLINTVLNIAYFRVATKLVKDRYKLSPVDLYHVHQGDDVWISSRSALWSRKLFYIMNNMGFIFQEKKQMFGNGAGEYLRVMYRQGQAYGYTQRCLVNYALRPVQDDMVEDMAAAAASYAGSLQLMSRRGVSIAGQRLLWADIVNHWLVVKAAGAASTYDRQAYRPGINYVTASPVVGGMGLALPGLSPTVTKPGTKGPEHFPILEWDMPAAVSSLSSPMTDDWLAHVSPKAHAVYRSQSINVEALSRQAKSTNYVAIARKANHGTSMLAYKRAILAWERSAPAWAAAHPRQGAGVDVCQAWPITNTSEASSWIEWFHQNNKAPTTYTGSLTASAMALAIPRRNDVLTYLTNLPALKTPMVHSVHRFEAQSVFKSVQVLSQAMGLPLRQALMAMVTLETKFSTGALDAAAVLQRHASEASYEFLNYALNRRVGFVSVHAAFMAHTVVDMLHATITDMVLNTGDTSKKADLNTLAQLDADANVVVMRVLAGRLNNLSRLAY